MENESMVEMQKMETIQEAGIPVSQSEVDDSFSEEILDEYETESSDFQSEKQPSEEVEDRNELILQGSLIRMQATAKYAEVQLVTDAAGEKALPTIIFYNPSLIRNVSPKSRVLIKGYCHTRIRKVNEENVMFDTVLAGTSIEPAPRVLNQFIETKYMAETEGGFGNDENYIICVGHLKNVIRISDSVSILIMECQNNGHRRIAEFFCFKRQSNYLKKLQKGDKIAVYGCVRTNQEKVGMQNMKQDIVCRDITKIS